MFSNVAIVGAGLSGVSCAYNLRQFGFTGAITLFEKSRGIGGRMSTRRPQKGAEASEPVFDHGAQFFTCKNQSFKKIIDIFETSGVVNKWSNGFPDENGKFPIESHVRFMCPQGMNSLPKKIFNLTENCILKTGIQIQSLKTTNTNGSHSGSLTLTDTMGDSHNFDQVFLSAPCPQTLKILEPVQNLVGQTELDALRRINYEPCFAVMIGLSQWDTRHLDNPIFVNGGQTFRNHKVFSFASEVYTKGISGVPGLLIHTNPDYTKDNIDKPQDVLLHEILDLACSFFKFNSSDIRSQALHLWRYAQPNMSTNHLSEPMLCLDLLQNKQLIAIGDGLSAGRVEGAFLSGLSGAALSLGIKI